MTVDRGGRAAIDARVSDKSQAEEDKASISEQTSEMEAYCERTGLTIVARYQEVGRGWSKKRPEFQRMLADARQGRFDAIVCWKSDRLSRGMYPAAALSLLWPRVIPLRGAEGVKPLAEHQRSGREPNMKAKDGVLDYLNLQRLGRVEVGETVEEDLRLNLQQGVASVETLQAAVAHCGLAQDFATGGILEGMTVHQAEDIDWLETQLDTIRQIGSKSIWGTRSKKEE